MNVDTNIYQQAFPCSCYFFDVVLVLAYYFIKAILLWMTSPAVGQTWITAGRWKALEYRIASYPVLRTPSSYPEVMNKQA